MTTTLFHPDGRVRIEPSRQGIHQISVEAHGNECVSKEKWETSYPVSLIDHVLRVKGPSYLCDEIQRDEDPDCLERLLSLEVLSHLARPELSQRRLLDFGCGSGASTLVLARLFPDATEIVGVELLPDYIELAEHRAAFHGLEKRLRFLPSNKPTDLPSGIGHFDYIFLSAVYEHLLPNERRMLLPILWRHLKPLGVIFLNQTPFRWFPIETHTTGLPFINYLPARMAVLYARSFSKRVASDESWCDLLRKGIRGATVHEIMGILNRDGRRARMLKPSRLGQGDRIDLGHPVNGEVGGSLAIQVRSVFALEFS